MKKIFFWLQFLFALNLFAQIEEKVSEPEAVFVKVKSGSVTFRRTIPPEDVREYIKSKLQNEKNGHYRISYRPGKETTYELEIKKIAGPAKETFEVIGSLVVLTLAVLYVARKL